MKHKTKFVQVLIIMLKNVHNIFMMKKHQVVVKMFIHVLNAKIDNKIIQKIIIYKKIMIKDNVLNFHYQEMQIIIN